MIISHIVAIGLNNEIGCKNRLLWHIPEDFKQFKKRTMNHHMLMGRKTFESIGKALPGRTTIVVSKNHSGDNLENLFFVSDIEAGIELAKSRGESELFICGGESIYRQCLPLAQKIYLTKVDYSGQADSFYPALSKNDWRVESIEEHQAIANVPSWTLSILVRS